MTGGQRPSILGYLREHTPADNNNLASDRDLLRQFAGCRDEDAFAALVRRHGALVLGVCRRVLGNEQDAEDACQATFLVLVRKAGVVRWRQSVAGWLYRTASHLALRTKRAAARRHSHEGRVQPRPPGDPLAEIGLREFQQALDEELARLPEKYRAPLVLCCLEGASRDEAAQQLGWPLQTLKSRLERGRELLRKRLARRGVTLSAALAAVTLGQDGVQAAIPGALANRTARAALLFAAGRPAAGQVSARVMGLAEGILKQMLTTKLTFAAALLLAAAAVPGVLYWPLGSAPGGPTLGKRLAEPARAAPAPRAKRAANDLGPEVRGLRARVTLPQQQFATGQPVEARYVVKNVSKVEQVLWHSGFWSNHLILVRDGAGKEPPLTAQGQLRRKAFSPGGDRKKNVYWPLPPGREDTTAGTYDLATLYDLSRSGRYTVQYVYEEKQGGWEGRLPSNVVTFEVLARGKKPAPASDGP